MVKATNKVKRWFKRKPRNVTERAQELGECNAAFQASEHELAKARAVRDPVRDWAWAYMDESVAGE